MSSVVERLKQQPAIGIATAVVASALTLFSWETGGAAAVHAGSVSWLLAGLLAIGIIAAHRRPIHVRQDTNIYVSSVPAMLAVALLPPALAVTVIALAKTAGELSVRAERGGFLRTSPRRSGAG